MLFSSWDLVGWIWQTDRGASKRRSILSHGVLLSRKRRETKKGVTDWQNGGIMRLKSSEVHKQQLEGWEL